MANLNYGGNGFPSTPGCFWTWNYFEGGLARTQVFVVCPLLVLTVHTPEATSRELAFFGNGFVYETIPVGV